MWFYSVETDNGYIIFKISVSSNYYINQRFYVWFIYRYFRELCGFLFRGFYEYHYKESCCRSFLKNPVLLLKCLRPLYVGTKKVVKAYNCSIHEMQEQAWMVDAPKISFFKFYYSLFFLILLYTVFRLLIIDYGMNYFHKKNVCMNNQDEI